MKIILLILLTSCTLLKAGYPKRPKLRGPPPPHMMRVPPSKQFSKKWYQQTQHPPRNHIRSRPIPVHMPPAHNIPMGKLQSAPRPVAPPARTFWKNAQGNVKFPNEKAFSRPEKLFTRQEKPIPRPEKSFLTAPSINIQEFDHHIQTNSIPTHVNPIKQVGEKGPIHTIPAPNLSPKDKPPMVEEVRYQQNNPGYVQVQQSHQYQVTEPSEILANQKLYSEQHQQYLQQQKMLQQLQQEQILQQELQKQVEIQPQQIYYAHDPAGASQNVQAANQGEIVLSSRLNPKELYQILGNAYPQMQQEETQQIQDYLSQQLYQAQQTQPAEAATEKASFQPEFHSFNYDEQAHQKSQQGLTNQELSSLVSAAYNLEASPADSKIISDRNSIDPLAQAQLIQRYFDTRGEDDGNAVEPDAKPSMAEENHPKKIKEELMSASYYSSLPNKEAAERLADLQAAGKINSSLMKITSEVQQNKDGMEIYVPDDNGKEDGQSVEYEDYSQEDQEESAEQNDGFGQKVQPKNE